jgi:blue copper oxidase
MQRLIFLISAVLLSICSLQAQYNTLKIPDTLTGPVFNLEMKDTFKQFRSGQQTITGGINSDFWGPTLIFNQGDSVFLNVTNNLNDSTTLHWHGMHLPAVMDGGPHQVIPPGTVWRPYWQVKNNAGLYWFHPHLHEMTMDQITAGLGGLIIVRDSIESSLVLPRTYGVDDIPLVITDRTFTASNQFNVEPYGDTVLVNGTLNPRQNVPAQIVRLRLLNGAIERTYNIGFSDNRSFSVIGTDGGLLNAPVSVTRYMLSPGERVEILVNFSGQSGTNISLKAFNSNLANFIAGSENFPNGPFANALGRRDFNIVNLNVVSQTSNPVTTIPTALTTNVFPDEANASLTRTITFSDSSGVTNPVILGPNAFILDHKLFDINYINYTVNKDAIEIWELKSSSIFAHPFHIHDVEFKILTRNGVAPSAEEAGWKDVVLVKGNETVRFIAKFDDFADATHPFMYHCHITLHEDEGMMGQFVVVDPTAATNLPTQNFDFQVFPNPSSDRIYLDFKDQNISAYYVTISTISGRALLMLPQPMLNDGIDVSEIPAGTYVLTLIDKKTKQASSVKFVKK